MICPRSSRVHCVRGCAWYYLHGDHSLTIARHGNGFSTHTGKDYVITVVRIIEHVLRITLFNTWHGMRAVLINRSWYMCTHNDSLFRMPAAWTPCHMNDYCWAWFQSISYLCPRMLEVAIHATSVLWNWCLFITFNDIPSIGFNIWHDYGWCFFNIQKKTSAYFRMEKPILINPLLFTNIL